MPTLRLNVGDPSEARIYYCPHYVAAEAGHYAAHGVTVAFVSSTSGGDTAMGGQIGPVVTGNADACVGGPMVTMKLQEQGMGEVVSFCALVRANPWVIAGQGHRTGGLQHLAGTTIIDSGNVTTATLCLKDALAAAGLTDAVAVEAGSGNLAADIARAQADGRVLVHHSLHALGPAVAAAAIDVILPMAGVSPPVPWSAYIARADRIAADPALFRSFRNGIALALLDVANRPASDIARLVARYYPEHGLETLETVISSYRQAGTFSATPNIPVADMDSFAAIMTRAGWLSGRPAIDRLLDQAIAA